MGGGQNCAGLNQMMNLDLILWAVGIREGFCQGEQHFKINHVGGTTWQCGERTGLQQHIFGRKVSSLNFPSMNWRG